MGVCPNPFRSDHNKLRKAETRFEKHDTTLAKEEAELTCKLAALKDLTPLLHDRAKKEHDNFGVYQQKLTKASVYFARTRARLTQVQTSRSAIQTQRQAAGAMLNNTEDFQLHRDLEGVRKITGSADAAYAQDVHHDDKMNLFKDLRHDTMEANKRAAKQARDLERATHGLSQVGPADGTIDLLAFAGIARTPLDEHVRLGEGVGPLLASPSAANAALGTRLQPPIEQVMQAQEEDHKHANSPGEEEENHDVYLEEDMSQGLGSNGEDDVGIVGGDGKNKKVPVHSVKSD
jgi:hypothetical protein